MTIKQVAIVTCFVNLKFECLYSNSGGVVPQPFPDFPKLPCSQPPNQPNLLPAYLPLLISLLWQTDRLWLLSDPTGIHECGTQTICLLLIVGNKFLNIGKCGSSCDKEPAIVQLPNAVVPHSLNITDGEGEVPRSGLTVSYKVWTTLVEGHQELFLCIDTLDLAEEPSGRESKRGCYQHHGWCNSNIRSGWGPTLRVGG